MGNKTDKIFSASSEVRKSDFIFSFSKVQSVLNRHKLLSRMSSMKELQEVYIHLNIIPGLYENAMRLENDAVKSGIRWIDYYSELYPPLLREIPDPPALLFYKGNPELFRGIFTAIVGTRKPSPVSVMASRALVSHIKNSGITGIVSGMALGIDREAMISALDEGLDVIGILGTPINNEYPVANLDLYERMKQSNRTLLVTEYHQEETVQKYSFPKRNRIISGITSTVFIMEAPLKSGAMSTANSALEQNRDVYVFSHPGQKYNQGGESLIVQGASVLSGEKMNLRLKHIDDALPAYESLPAYLANIQKQKNAKKITEFRNGYFNF